MIDAMIELGIRTASAIAVGLVFGAIVAELADQHRFAKRINNKEDGHE